MPENENNDKNFKQEVDENNDKSFKQVDDLKSGESIEEEALTDLQIQYGERIGLEGV